MADLAQRAWDIGIHYSDAEILPREFLLSHPAIPAGALSLHALSGSEGWIGFLFAVHACVALTLLLGFRTRLSAVTCWLLLLSLHLRGPAYVMSGDRLLSLLVLWSIFLPLGARFSLDRTPVATRGDHGFVSIAGAALLGQVAVFYLVTAFAKSGELWWSGRAVAFALGQASYATSAGAWLREWDMLLSVLTYATLFIEFLGPFVAFSPFWTGPLRSLAVLGFFCFHAGLAIFLSIGLYPLFAVTAWLVFIPSWLWDRVIQKRESGPQRATAEPMRWAMGPSRSSGGLCRVVPATVSMLLLVTVACLIDNYTPGRLLPRKSLSRGPRRLLGPKVVHVRSRAAPVEAARARDRKACGLP